MRDIIIKLGIIIFFSAGTGLIVWKAISFFKELSEKGDFKELPKKVKRVKRKRRVG